jgi:hypothetical protein
MLNLEARWQKILRLTCILIFLLSFITVNVCFAKDINYKIEVQSDGGYLLKISLKKIILFSADGFFHKFTNDAEIRLIGKGEDLTYRNHNGYFYNQNNVSGFRWDFGYAWVDIERKYIYLNFYWLCEPDGMIPSDFNGKYKITND